MTKDKFLRELEKKLSILSEEERTSASSYKHIFEILGTGIVFLSAPILKEKLESQLMGNDPYEKIYETSTQIDKLLVKYYEKDMINNKKNSLENIFRKDLSY